ncbi:hypothetical protein N3K66_007225 [Trichothecium roseum]|uniref:Uncharacterized protein n=1 Tax=Trichothecium roseum TaxID=47278 RepID=A0ACC0UV26_9HYPO|nr:hypothetical protein N3K66_007225 [Trichothecium roseum]
MAQRSLDLSATGNNSHISEHATQRHGKSTSASALPGAIDDTVEEATEPSTRARAADRDEAIPLSNYVAPSSGAYAPPSSSSQDSPEPSQTDLQGHYVGPASGVSFLLRVQKRLHQAISFSSASTIFTFGDAPLSLPEFDPSFCMMLPRDDARRLVGRYFDFAMPTYRFLHRPTIQAWFDEFYDTMGVMRDAQSAPARVALLFMVFAHARVYMPDDDKPGPADLSTRYYLAAEHQLTKERGSICLTSVQARLTQCYYLLTQSRINHCWSLFGTISHLALAIGLNRHRRPNPANGVTVLDAECRRRTFWCAYTLDAYLSVALGRPRSFHDDDIDTELPSCVDDDEITADRISVSTFRNGPPTMLAPIAHIKLARILSKIVRDLYSIKPISASRRAIVTERISKDLSDWRVELARFLDDDAGGGGGLFNPSLLVPIFQRQRNVLNLTYWHAIILTYRPFVLSNLAQLSRQGSGGGGGSAEAGEDVQTRESVRQCLVAAMSTVKTIDEITQSSQMFRAFWITAYFAFTATIVLYIYVIQKRASPPDVYSEYFSAAVRCQSHIAAIAEQGSLSDRYCLVLEELRVEALRQVRRMHPSMVGAAATATATATTAATPAAAENTRGQLEDASLAGMMAMFDDSPGAATSYTELLADSAVGAGGGMPDFLFSDSDVSGWGHFASMVSSGLGNLDLFLNANF